MRKCDSHILKQITKTINDVSVFDKKKLIIFEKNKFYFRVDFQEIISR